MPYPLPVFRFRVDWGGTQATFSEVTGLNIETQVIEYRDGLSPEYSSVKMPGLKKYGNVTLKRGVFANDNDYSNFMKELDKPDTFDRRDLTISLLNEEQQPVMTWNVMQAWPTKLTSPDLKASGNEAAIETLELAHEGITIGNP